MSTVPAEVDTLDRLLDPVRDCLTPEVAARIAALRADTATQERLDELAGKNAAGQLSAEERAEYEAYVRAGNPIPTVLADHGRSDP
jgi:hypothetical protein